MPSAREAVPASPTRFPRVVFDAPVFRGLDERAEQEIEAAGTLRELAPGEALYRTNDACDAFFVVARGELSVSARRRGDDVESVLRRAQVGDALGEEAFASARRRSTAASTTASTVAEIPVHIFRRAAVRSGKAELAERLERAMQRAAMRDLLRTTALGADLDRDAFDVVLDAAKPRQVARGESVYREGEAADAMFVVADGRVQMQVDDDARLRVRGYLGPGDFFGDEEILAEGGPRARASSAVASGATSLVEIPASVVLEIARREPALFTRYRRVAADEQRAKGALIAGAAKNATQHLFRDVYRLEIARSLLVIDLESCVRCGHCTWTCGALHGTPRLVRRGDKIVTTKGASSPSILGALSAFGGESAHLMVPSSCQHCENPACMVDCPTGAIGKDASGEVFIREELCTGCGACARACPWDNIQMAERPAAAPRPAGTPADSTVAVKCDLCTGYASGPACVQACPTDALHRIDPSNDLAELRAWLGDRARPVAGELAPRPASAGAASRAAWVLGSLGAAVAIGVVGALMQSRRLFVPNKGIGYAAGVACAVGMLALLAYVGPKRLVRVWKRRSPSERRVDAKAAQASITRPLLTAHVALGWITLALGLAHAPIAFSKGTAPQLLLLALAATTVAGGFMALAYRLAPKRLARIERTAILPEDFAAEKRALVDRLYRSVSGRSEVVKKLAEKILLPYARSFFGPVALLLSGRDLKAEQRALEARVERVLEGRGRDRLAGIDDLVRVVVEIRSVPAQQILVGILRVGLPVHVVTFTAAIVLGVAHVIFGVGR